MNICCVTCHKPILQPVAQWYAGTKYSPLKVWICGICLDKIPQRERHAVSEIQEFQITFAEKTDAKDDDGVYTSTRTPSGPIRFWTTAEAIDAFIKNGIRLLSELYPFFCLKEYVGLVEEQLKVLELPTQERERRIREAIKNTGAYRCTYSSAFVTGPGHVEWEIRQPILHIPAYVKDEKAALVLENLNKQIVPKPDAKRFRLLGNAAIERKCEDAAEWFEMALKLDPQDFESLHGLGRSYACGAGECGQEKMFKGLTRQDAARQAIRVFEGLLVRMDDEEKAAAVYHTLAQAWLELDNHNEAIEALCHAVKLDSKCCVYWDLLTHVYLQQREETAAKNAAQKALEADSTYAPAHLVLARLYDKSNQLQAATESYQAYLHNVNYSEPENAYDIKKTIEALRALREAAGQTGIKDCGIKLRSDGKLWVSTEGESCFIPKVKKCLASGFLYSIQFDFKGFDRLMEEEGIPRADREQFIKKLRLDDDTYIYAD